MLDIALVVGLEGFLELNFLSMPSRVQELRLDTKGFLCECRVSVNRSSFALAPVVSIISKDVMIRAKREIADSYFRSK